MRSSEAFREIEAARCPLPVWLYRQIPAAVRLLDQVVRSPAFIKARDAAGVTRHLTSVGAKASSLDRCSLRYILDEDVAEQCRELIRRDNGLLDPDNELLRIPGELFWVEWPAETSDGSACRSSLAALVEASPSGRSGTVTGFFESKGQADLLILTTEFDLDHPMESPAGSRDSLRLAHAELRHLNKLFDHSRLTFDPTWRPFLEARGAAGFQTAVRELSGSSWFNLPMVLAFAALVNSGEVLDERRSELTRLNVARAKRGQPPLLEHVQVQMRLGSRGSGASGAGSSSGRSSPRLHYVRGHLVRRGGATFWRAPHMRGDHHSPILSKTVLVTTERTEAALGRGSRSPPNLHRRGG